MKIAPKKAAIIEEPSPPKPAEVKPAIPAPQETPPPRAVLVKPQRALPVEEIPPPQVEAPRAVPRALPVDE